MPKKFLISRTDSIGDVLLTLPLCGWIKEKFPDCLLYFLGQAYTQPIIDCFPAIDEFIDWKTWENRPKVEQISYFQSLNIDCCIHVFPRKSIAQLAKKVKIPLRIGTSHRLFHLYTCNQRINFTRKNSAYHEAQLNFELLRPLGLNSLPSLEKAIDYLKAFNPTKQYPLDDLGIADLKTKKIILHPKSNGSAVEWPIEKYYSLARKLADHNYTVYFSGTEKEGLLFRDGIPKHPQIIDASGKFSLPEFIGFIAESDGLVACSTGPLHISAALGILAVGLFSEERPIHPGRWKPLGAKSNVITAPTKNPPKREDIYKIQVDDVLQCIIENTSSR